MTPSELQRLIEIIVEELGVDEPEVTPNADDEFPSLDFFQYVRHAL